MTSIYLKRARRRCDLSLESFHVPEELVVCRPIYRYSVSGNIINGPSNFLQCLTLLTNSKIACY
ncbi:hypothetical protein BS17DRAFT_777613, partial [Gyrodon lividus]